MKRARLEELRNKYRMAKREEGNIDLLSLRLEIESYIRELLATDKGSKDFLAEAQDMLIDVIRIIEESHCQPLK